MPRGPRGEKRPADVIGNAVHVMRIATGEIEDKPEEIAQEKILLRPRWASAAGLPVPAT